MIGRKEILLGLSKGLCVLVFASTTLYGQTKKTILLVRHAEKDVSEKADANDPELSSEGRDRAQRLVKRIKQYKPGAVYSTNFKRTRDTVTPLAQKRKKAVQIYDAKKPDELIAAIIKSRTKRFLVVGHSNTIPGLANLLGKKELFKNLDESEYGAIWVISIRDGLVRGVEILNY